MYSAVVMVYLPLGLIGLMLRFASTASPTISPMLSSPPSTAMWAVLDGSSSRMAPVHTMAVAPSSCLMAPTCGSRRKQSVPWNVHAFVMHLRSLVSGPF